MSSCNGRVNFKPFLICALLAVSVTLCGEADAKRLIQVVITPSVPWFYEIPAAIAAALLVLVVSQVLFYGMAKYRKRPNRAIWISCTVTVMIIGVLLTMEIAGQFLLFHRQLSSADQGNYESMRWVAQQYLIGNSITAKNYEEAYYWWQLASNKYYSSDERPNYLLDAKAHLSTEKIKEVDRRVEIWLVAKQKK